MPIDENALFLHNPPTNPEHLHKLFVGRDFEWERLKARIPGSHSGTIRAIHGFSRVGKSHLALRFLMDLEGQFHLLSIGASSGKKARLILQEIYERLREILWEVSKRADEDPSSLQLVHPKTLAPLPPNSKEEGVSSYQVLARALECMEDFDQLMLDQASAAEQASTIAKEDGAGLEVKPQGIGLTASAKETRTTGAKILRSALNEYGLVRVIGDLCEDLCITTGKSVLIYVDDVDLLDMGPSASKDEVVVLVRCLHKLAARKSVTVVTSLRTRHLHIGDKEFSEVVQVHPLPDRQLKEIYQRHIDEFHDKSPIMDDNCLDEIVLHASGKIGSMLRLCYRFRDWGLQMRPGKLLTVADLEAYFADRIREFLLVPDYRPYIDAIVSALKSSLEVSLEPGVLETGIAYTLLEEPPEPMLPKRFTISRLAARTLRVMYAEPPQQAAATEPTGAH